jgi:3',5'-cyclic AMP phosphodiesterase CpdA
MLVLAHLSDPHLGPLPRPRPAELASKRIVGLLNWLRKRRAIHRPEVLDAIVRDLKSQAPDHIAVTGDLGNISLPGEFITGRRWLEQLGSAQNVSFVPGNHDIYVRTAEMEPARHWGAYMRGDQGVRPADDADGFPFVRWRENIALIGLSTAVATAPLMATGRLGVRQMARFAEILGKLTHRSLFRVVLIHHPPAGKRHAYKRLVDAKAFRRVLAQHGAELILHGHDHKHALEWIDGPKGRIPVVGAPSASMIPGQNEDPAAYNLYWIDGSVGAWRCEMVSRGLRAGSNDVVELKRMTLIGN